MDQSSAVNNHLAALESTKEGAEKLVGPDTIPKSVIHVPIEQNDKKIPPDISVRALLEHISFVTQGDTKKMVDWKGLFSTKEPNAGLDGLFDVCVLPPQDVLEKMLENYAKMKAKSVLDWSYKAIGKEVRYPPTVLSIYREFGRANKTRMIWRQAEDWLTRWTAQTKNMEDVAFLARRLVSTLEWNTFIRATGTSVPTNGLLSMLSDEWMSDNQLDMILQTLTERTKHSAEEHKAIIAPCVFVQHVKNMFLTRNEQNRLTAPLLEVYKTAFINGRKETVFFVSLVGSNHFVAWKFDYRTATLSHGDSLGVNEKKLDETKISVLWWMKTLYPDDRTCTYLGNKVSHGDQTKGDGFSCGIIACNAIAHELFGDELWDMGNRRRLRIQAFNAIVMHHNQRRARRTCSQSNIGSDDDDAEILEVRIMSSWADPKDTAQNDRILNNRQGAAVPDDDNLGLSEPHESAEYYTSGPPTSISSSRLSSPTTSILYEGEQLYSKTLDDETIEESSEAQEDVRRSERRHDHLVQIQTCAERQVVQLRECTEKQDTQVSDGKESGPKLDAAARTKRDREQMGSVGRPTKRNKILSIGPLDMFLRPVDGSANQREADTKKGLEPLMVVDETEGSENRHDQRGNEVHASKGSTTDAVTRLGQSRSARHARKMREARLSGTQTVNQSLYEQKIRLPCLEYDPDAQFDPGNWKIQHSRCRRWTMTKSLYQPGYFIDHVIACNLSTDNSKLDKFFSRSQADLRSSSMPTRLPNKPLPLVTRSCAGLTGAHDSRIDTYLRRPTALGGGGKPVHTLARETYGKLYSQLGKSKKKEIDRLHEAGWSWMVKNRHSAIYSTSCEKTIEIPESHLESQMTCRRCKDLFHLKSFRNAISHEEPESENLKFVRKAYQNTEISLKFLRIKGVAELIDPKNDQIRVAVRYAIGVANGEFVDHVVFTGLVDTVLRRMERERKGLQMNNFKYPPAFDEFITTVHMVSPSAHRLLKDHFPVRTDRSIRKRNARNGQFLAGISDRSFERAAKYVRALNVPGNMVALSADDTKLFATFRPFLDREKDEWSIVGGTEGPYIINDLEDIREELEKAQLVKATKVRIWVLQVPLPKVPPIILAALSIADDVSTEELFSYSMEVIDGLHRYDIWPISYACDGTEKERANQRRLRGEAHSSDTRRIPAPSYRAPHLDIQIPKFHGKPMALVQDSLHARKTGRNNIQSGTKTMVLGDFPVLYEHLRDMAFDEKSPLYHRDVEKADKQDDRAAARVYSADALEWLLSHGKKYHGTAFLLFVVGELVDAIQNRNLPLLDRAQMVLRAFYFFDMWKNFLQVAGYQRNRACLSREALDIYSILITGFFETLFIYRESFEKTAVPLLPWLHSSEACEHVFGECRKIVKDFDFASFLHMMPKIHSKLHYALQFGAPSIEDAKGRARGYIHTWMDTEGLSLGNLAKFPTDKELSEVAKLALEEAEELWMQLEVFPQDICPSPERGLQATKNMKEKFSEDNVNPALPSIAFWHPDMASSDEDSDAGEDDEQNRVEAEELDTREPRTGLSILESERMALEQLFEKEQEANEKGPIRRKLVDDTMLNLSCAKLFLDFDTDIQIDEMHEPTQDTFDEWVTMYSTEVGKLLADSLPLVCEPAESDRLSSLLNNGHLHHLSRETMVSTRRAHQSKLEQKAVRTQYSTHRLGSESFIAGEAKDDEKKARRLLVAKMNEILNEQQDVGKGTGAERRLRWTDSKVTGNAANAATVSAKAADELLSKRSKVYSEFPISLKVYHMLSNAGVNSTYTLHNGMFAIIHTNEKIFVAQVLSLFSRGGGAHGHHGYTTKVDKITQPSYISVQAFEHISDKPVKRKHDTILELSRLSFDVWSQIQPISHMIPDVMKRLKSRK